MAVEKVLEKVKASVIMQNQNGTQRCGAGPGSVSDGKLMLCVGWASHAPSAYAEQPHSPAVCYQ
jgi:hypothetical protein